MTKIISYYSAYKSHKGNTELFQVWYCHFHSSFGLSKTHKIISIKVVLKRMSDIEWYRVNRWEKKKIASKHFAGSRELKYKIRWSTKWSSILRIVSIHGRPTIRIAECVSCNRTKKKNGSDKWTFKWGWHRERTRVCSATVRHSQ